MTAWTEPPTSAQDVVRMVRAYLDDRRSKLTKAQRRHIPVDALVSAGVPVALQLLAGLAEVREIEADEVWQNGGWTPARCGDEHPLRWCARNGVEESADALAYGVEYPGRVEVPAEVQPLLDQLKARLERNTAEQVVLLSMLDELAGPRTRKSSRRKPSP